MLECILLLSHGGRPQNEVRKHTHYQHTQIHNGNIINFPSWQTLTNNSSSSDDDVTNDKCEISSSSYSISVANRQPVWRKLPYSDALFQRQVFYSINSTPDTNSFYIVYIYLIIIAVHVVFMHNKIACNTQTHSPFMRKFSHSGSIKSQIPL